MNKAKGKRGSWFAEIEGENLPCVHKEWYKQKAGKFYYLDPGAKAGEKKWDDFIEVIQNKKRVVLTHDTMSETGSFQRTKYVAIFEVDNVIVDNAGLYFDVVKKLEDVR